MVVKKAQKNNTGRDEPVNQRGQFYTVNSIYTRSFRYFGILKFGIDRIWTKFGHGYQIVNLSRYFGILYFVHVQNSKFRNINGTQILSTKPFSCNESMHP